MIELTHNSFPVNSYVYVNGLDAAMKSSISVSYKIDERISDEIADTVARELDSKVFPRLGIKGDSASALASDLGVLFANSAVNGQNIISYGLGDLLVAVGKSGEKSAADFLKDTAKVFQAVRREKDVNVIGEVKKAIKEAGIKGELTSDIETDVEDLLNNGAEIGELAFVDGLGRLFKSVSATGTAAQKSAQIIAKSATAEGYKTIERQLLDLKMVNPAAASAISNNTANLYLTFHNHNQTFSKSIGRVFEAVASAGPANAADVTRRTGLALMQAERGNNAYMLDTLNKAIMDMGLAGSAGRAVMQEMGFLLRSAGMKGKMRMIRNLGNLAKTLSTTENTAEVSEKLGKAFLRVETDLQSFIVHGGMTKLLKMAVTSEAVDPKSAHAELDAQLGVVFKKLMEDGEKEKKKK